MSQDSTLRSAVTQRPVRSYVLRQGRISVAQQRAYQELAQEFCIAYAQRSLDLTQVFDRQAAKILEIGFGMGDTTAAIAAARPECDFLGIEVHTPGVGALLKLLQTQSLHNVRIIQHDAVEVLREMITPNILDGAHIFFPDPWPKKRHHKRRLIRADFVALLAGRLKPGGYLHLATDWQDYAVQMLEVLRAEPLLRNRVQEFCPRPAHRPLTKFERRAQREGRDTWDLVFERV